MARIRTIKPEFFTSFDVVTRSPLARLLYIGLWCEADREGRLTWKPRTLKLRYLPGDGCDIDALASELEEVGMLVIYEVDGVLYAEIPGFKKHQIINNRESESEIPSRVTHASQRVKAEGRKEGKEGKEGRVEESTSSEPDGFREFWNEWPRSDRKEAKGKCLEVWRKQRLEGKASEILAHLVFLKTSNDWTKQGGQFIPAPLVYLNQRKWEGAEVAAPSNPLQLFGGV